MGKHHDDDAPASEKKKLGRKKRLKLLQARVEALEQQLSDLSRVVDEAIRSSITARAKAQEVRPRRRKASGDASP